MDAHRIHGLHIQSEDAQAGTPDSRKIEANGELLLTWRSMSVVCEWSPVPAQRVGLLTAENHELDAPVPQPSPNMAPDARSLLSVFLRGNTSDEDISWEYKDLKLLAASGSQCNTCDQLGQSVTGFAPAEGLSWTDVEQTLGFGEVGIADLAEIRALGIEVPDQPVGRSLNNHGRTDCLLEGWWVLNPVAAGPLLWMLAHRGPIGVPQDPATRR
ncbi:hypothetical protein L618_006600000010 [Rhodococcus rhodochrous J45]|uniref:Uncharacterized protein n=1 Tax=Rhodococcus rhodochrous J45 TaxID=935266 RepID=A0A562DH06_RHORH|nr:hypothetical protein [Rhodococcus rhodochrous]TWH08901.1 hypothetical protein L618_006600000010 [Rhodococcus rhodochrous J45]